THRRTAATRGAAFSYSGDPQFSAIAVIARRYSPQREDFSREAGGVGRQSSTRFRRKDDFLMCRVFLRRQIHDLLGLKNHFAEILSLKLAGGDLGPLLPLPGPGRLDPPGHADSHHQRQPQELPQRITKHASFPPVPALKY